QSIREYTLEQLGADKAAIFDAHLLVLSDPELINPIEEKISNDKVNAEHALRETADMFITIFEQMENDYMKERAVDIKDVTKRVMAHLLNVQIPNPSTIAEEVIIIANDLTPSDTAQLNRQFVKGFVTDIGGRTSHSAIMARTLEIPAVVGTKNITEIVKQDEMVIIDGLDGKVIVNPTEEQIAEYREKQEAYAQQQAQWAKLKDEPTFTKDGQQVELVAN